MRMQVEHVDGHTVELKSEGVTRPGQVRVIKGEGMPVYESVRNTLHRGSGAFNTQRHKGDLYVTYSVAFPRQLAEEQKRVVRETFPADTPMHLHEEL